MPDYSEYVVIRSKAVEYYCHYRGDRTFMSDLFWGEVYFFDLLKRQAKYTEGKGDNSLSRVVFNVDTKQLMLQLSPPEDGRGIIYMETYLGLLALAWKGWRIERFSHGYDSFKAYLGQIDMATIQYDYLKDLWDEPIGTLVSEKKEGVLRVYWVEKNIAEVIAKWQLQKDQLEFQHLEKKELPFMGVHFDYDSQEIYSWYGNPAPNFDKWISTYFTGWSIVHEGINGYQKHFQIIESKVSFQEVLKELRPKVLHDLKIEIVGADEEPVLEDGVYTFTHRKIGYRERSRRFYLLVEEYKRSI